MIVADESSIVREIQLVIRRELDRRGKSLKAISFDAGVPYSTLLSYFPGDRNAVPHAMPVAALRKLIGHIPADLMSLMLPDGWQIVHAPEEVDHDAIAEACRAYLSAKEAAHRKDSPAERDIADCEDRTLRAAAVSLRAVA
jgi:hypothetical protein